MKKPLFIFLSLFLSINAYSQEKKISDGPFNQLIIRGAILVNGNGSPPLGPVDIVIEKNIIKSIKTVGYPGVEIVESRRPKLKKMQEKLMLMECMFFQVSLICMDI